MRKKLLALSIALAFTSTPGIIHAKENIRAGKEKAAMCSGCHGEDGNSAMPLFPKLAGQHPSYTSQQLMAFKNGSRKDPTMAPMALSLSIGDMDDIAAYYASQKISANTLPPPLERDEDDEDDDESPEEAVDMDAVLALGQDLYRNGDLKREVSACIACHGPNAEGNKPAAFPALNSQHADYLIKALKDFKSGSRSNSAYNMMHMITKKMTDQEIEAVSYHISMMK